MALTERAGVEIDYCPDCRGIWLDRGELDRIIEHSGVSVRQDERSGAFRGRDEYEHHHDRDHDHDRRGHGEYDDRYGWPGKKRGGAFSALTGLLGGGED